MHSQMDVSVVNVISISRITMHKRLDEKSYRSRSRCIMEVEVKVTGPAH